MDEMESKLNAILGNPQMMQQIMSMAQAFQKEDTRPEEAPPPPKPSGPPSGLDMNMLQKI